MTIPTPEEMVAGLIRKRAEIAAIIEGLQRQVKSATAQFDRVEATIRIFKPDLDFGGLMFSPVPPRHGAFRGEVTGILIATLREATEPLSTAELTETLMRARGLPVEDRRLRRTMLGRVGSSLNSLRRKKGIVSSMPGPGQTLLWRLAETRRALTRR
jgi:hypothetical protein